MQAFTGFDGGDRSRARELNERVQVVRHDYIGVERQIIPDGKRLKPFFFNDVAPRLQDRLSLNQAGETWPATG
jgi:hypothetical protein